MASNQEPTGETGSPGAPRGGQSLGRIRELGWTWVPSVAVLASLVVALYLGKQFVDRAGSATDPLSELEQTFFGIYTLFVGAAVSWLCTHYYARRETLARFQQLARPALRRVVAARESAGGLLQAIDRRDPGDPPKEDLRSLRELVEQHARVLDDAMADWQELLPDELNRQAALEVARHRQLLTHIQNRLEAVETRTSNADPEVAALRKELELLKTASATGPAYTSGLKDRSWKYGFTNPSDLTGADLLKILETTEPVAPARTYLTPEHADPPDHDRDPPLA